MDDSQPLKQVCGVCGDEWLSEEEYLNHVCPNTNYNPTQPEHLINSTTPEFAAVQAAALERGLETVKGDEVAEARQQEAIQQLGPDTPPAPEQPPIS